MPHGRSKSHQRQPNLIFKKGFSLFITEYWQHFFTSFCWAEQEDWGWPRSLLFCFGCGMCVCVKTCPHQQGNNDSQSSRQNGQKKVYGIFSIKKPQDRPKTPDERKEPG